MNNQDLNSYIRKVVEYSFEANKYFNDSQPWSLKKTDPIRMQTILFTIVEQIKNISILLNPIMPIATNKILESLNIEESERTIANINKIDCFDHTRILNKTKILFKKIEDDN